MMIIDFKGPGILVNDHCSQVIVENHCSISGRDGQGPIPTAGGVFEALGGLSGILSIFCCP